MTASPHASALPADADATEDAVAADGREPAAHLAQINVATLRYPLDDPRMKPFVDLLAPVNAAADGTPGFVWRLAEEGETDATGMRPAGEDVIVNMSMWESQEALWDFTYRSGHLDVMRRRREWFDRHVEAHHLVLWWVPAGYVPTVHEALERLAELRANGPTPRAFTFASGHSAAEAGYGTEGAAGTPSGVSVDAPDGIGSPAGI